MVWNVQRRRQEVNDGVRQQLDAHVLFRGAYKNWNELPFNRQTAQFRHEFLTWNFLFVQEHFSDFVRIVPYFVEQRFICLRPLRLVFRRQRLADDFRVALSRKRDVFLGDDVDDAVEGVLRPVRQIDWSRAIVELRIDLFNRAFKRRADTVHFVHEGDFRHGIVVRLAPHFLRLRLHAFHSGENDGRAVDDTQRTFHFRREIDVSGSVDQMEHIVFPRDGGCCCGDGDAARPFFRQKIHDSRPVVDIAVAMGQPRIVQKAFRRACLACINMRDDAQISDLLNVLHAMSRSLTVISQFYNISQNY